MRFQVGGSSAADNAAEEFSDVQTLADSFGGRLRFVGNDAQFAIRRELLQGFFDSRKQRCAIEKMFLVIGLENFQGLLDIQSLIGIEKRSFDKIHLPIPDVTFGLRRAYRFQGKC